MFILSYFRWPSKAERIEYRRAAAEYKRNRKLVRARNA